MVDAEGDLGGDTDEEVDAEDMKKLDIGTSLNVEVTIAEAEGIPANVANDVHCKYHLYNQREVTTPCLSGTRVVWNSTSSFRFKVTPSLLDFFDEKFLLVNVSVTHFLSSHWVERQYRACTTPPALHATR